MGNMHSIILQEGKNQEDMMDTYVWAHGLVDWSPPHVVF